MLPVDVPAPGVPLASSQQDFCNHQAKQQESQYLFWKCALTGQMLVIITLVI